MALSYTVPADRRQAVFRIPEKLCRFIEQMFFTFPGTCAILQVGSISPDRITPEKRRTGAVCCRYWTDESPEIREIVEEMNRSPLIGR